MVEDFKQLSPDKKRAKTDNALLEKVSRCSINVKLVVLVLHNDPGQAH